jgi:hypothetical protein
MLEKIKAHLRRSYRSRFNDRNYPWYDSPWLSSYVRAKAYMKVKQPKRYDEFVNCLEVLKTQKDFKTLDLGTLLEGPTLKEANRIVQEKKTPQWETHELARFGRFALHDHSYFTKLQESLTEKVSKWAGEECEPCYNFFSMYLSDGKLPPHMDAPSAKWTLDICLDQSQIWPLYVSKRRDWPEDFDCNQSDWQSSIVDDADNSFDEYHLEPGQALLFSGSSQWHYREPLANKGDSAAFCDMLHLHYVPKGCAEFIHPKNWAKYFDLPDLNRLVD